MKATDIPLPESWQDNVKRGMNKALQLARFDIIRVRGKVDYDPRREVRLKAQLDKVKNELALERDLNSIYRSRFEKIPAKRRPNYTPVDRMRVLNHKAARGWNLKQASENFLIDPQTLSSWDQRMEEGGANALVQIKEPVHKYPDYLRYGLQQLKALIPLMGKKKIGEYFIRAGLTLSTSTVGRALKNAIPDKPFIPDPEHDVDPKEEIKVVTSRHPDHTWMCDLTVVPTHFGMWVEWPPQCLLQFWPFCWWVAVVIDHFSRRVMGIRVFKYPPSSDDMTDFLDKIIDNTGKKPKYIISDKGCQFHSPRNAKNPHKHHYRKWCRKMGILPRYGAVGKYGSIAIIERFMKTLKNECTRKITIPMNIYQMQHELVLFVIWYNIHRPHSAFLKHQNKCEPMGAMTPDEVFNGLRSPPCRSWGFRHNSEIPKITIEISYFEGRRHLPIIEIKDASSGFKKVA